MRILGIYPGLNPAVSDIAHALAHIGDLGHKVTVITARRNPSKSINQSTAYEEMRGLHIHRLYETFNQMIWFPWMRHRAVRSVARAFQPDVILCSQEFNMRLARTIQREHPVPIVLVVELFTVEPDGDDNLRVSGALAANGDVTNFVWSPDSDFIAYRANQDSSVIFELYVTTPDGSLSDVKVSGTPMVGDVDTSFAWSPDNTRVAYRANQRTANAIELFTSTPDGDTNDRVSGDLVSNGNVESFKWAPDSTGIGYIADQESNEFFELFASTPDGEENVRLSGSFAEAGDVLFFEWEP